MRAAVVGALLLAGCAPRLAERTAPVLPVQSVQAADQCRAQPALDWCRP